jgi:hypothetical protein
LEYRWNAELDHREYLVKGRYGGRKWIREKKLIDIAPRLLVSHLIKNRRIVQKKDAEGFKVVTVANAQNSCLS